MSAKLITSIFSLLALCCACSSQDEPQVTGSIANPSGDVVEWNLDMSIPDEPKTRAAASVSPGSDGLYTFTGRDINKLWYAVYYNDQWIYDCTSSEAQQAVKIGDNFSLVFKLPKLYDPTKVKLFFWAGNADDAVSTNNVTSVSNGINLNFAERCVSIDPKYVNGGNTSIAEYDSFCGYFQLSSTTNVTNFNLKFTLKRPFAQIHLLTSEFEGEALTDLYPSGMAVSLGFGNNNISLENHTSELSLPTTWFYDDSKTLSPSYKKGDYIYSQNNSIFSAGLSKEFPYTTTMIVKGQPIKYTYLSCLLTFAPTESGTSNIPFNKLNFIAYNPDDGIQKGDFFSIPMIDSGIRANNRYVIRNLPGENPLFSESYSFTVDVNNYFNGFTENETN